jgi:hypothetical protein
MGVAHINDAFSTAAVNKSLFDLSFYVSLSEIDIPRPKSFRKYHKGKNGRFSRNIFPAF